MLDILSNKLTQFPINNFYYWNLTCALRAQVNISLFKKIYDILIFNMTIFRAVRALIFSTISVSHSPYIIDHKMFKDSRARRQNIL